MDNDDPKTDNITDSNNYDSVDTYVIDSEEMLNNIYNKNHFSISNNLRYEYGLIQKLSLTLDSLNAIGVNDIELLLSYIKDIDDLMLILTDIHHTLKMLAEFNKTFKMKDINRGYFAISVSNRNRRRIRRLKKKSRRRLKI